MPPEQVYPSPIEIIVHDDHTQENWMVVKDRLIEIEQMAFGENANLALITKGYFDKRVTFIIAKNQTNPGIVGYLALVKRPKKYGEFFSIAVDPNYQGQGVAGRLMTKMEEVCRQKKIRYLFGDFGTNNNWSDKVIERYGEAVIERHPPHVSKYGDQVRLVIDLEKDL